MKLKEIWEKISAQGTYYEQPPTEVRRTRLTNQLGVVCAVITLAWAIYFWDKNPLLIQGIFGLEIILFLSVAWWSRQRAYLLAKYALVTTVSYSIFMVSSCFGPEAMGQLIYIPIFLGTTLVFDFKNRLQFFLPTLIPIFFILLIEWTGYSLFTIPDLTPQVVQRAFYGILAVTFSGSFLVIWYYLTAVEEQEVSVQKINEKFRAIFEHSLDAIFLMDLQSLQIEDCNKRAIDILGGEIKGDFVGRTACFFQVGLRDESVCEVMRQEVKEDGFWKAELKTQTFNGEVFWGQWGISLLPGEGTELGLVRITNIQAQKETELSLVQSQSALLEGQKLARMGNTTLDFSDMYSYWSNELYDIFGVPEDFVPKMENVVSLMHPDDRERVSKNVWESMKKKAPFEDIYRVIRPKDGREVYIQSRGHFIFDKNGENPKLRAVVQDITQLKFAERQLSHAKEEAEAANRAKGHFLTSMSHEIRTPLNGILGFTNLLLQGTTPEEQKHYLELIQSSGDILLRLLSDILDFNKVDQGQLSLEEIDFDFRKTISDCLEPYELQVNEKGLAFELSISPDIPPYLVGDTTRIKQIIVNLVSNAIKFTQKGMIKAVFRVDEDHLLSQDTCMLVIEVHDTGIGIPPEKHTAIFQAFDQADSSITRKYGGSGLGLAIVRELSLLMGGEVDLISPAQPSTSSPGAIFISKVPLKIGNKPIHSETLKKGTPLIFAQNPTILLVEDNLVNQVLSKKLLNKLGASVLIAENGVEAVECVSQKEAQIDLILMDIQMPQMNGYDATRVIRKSCPKMPIIALSANAYREDINKSFEAGMNDYLSKPFKEVDLFSIVNKWI